MNSIQFFYVNVLGWLIIVSLSFTSCRPSQETNKITFPLKDTITNTNIREKVYISTIPDDWIEITEEDGVSLDIKYATTNNFTEKVIYDCSRCFLRPEAAKLILRIQYDISERYGYSLKLFDCYRPRSAQQKLWDIVPNAMYVTPPHKGSMHNRGQAIDLTIIDEDGEEMDMGTPYDFFGPEAHTDYTHPDLHIRANRKLIWDLMHLHGFKGIRTEWWHYSLKTVTYPLDDWEWECLD